MSPRDSAHRSPVTIGDVAAAAGVSRSTVSRAFSHPHLLRQETVNRIRVVAARLGYVANQAARALSTGKSGNIAVVVPDIGNPFFPPMVRTVQAGADRAGYAVFLGDSDESADREAVLVARLSTQVEGFILASSRMSESLIQKFARSRPVVLVNREIADIPRVLIDSNGGIIEAVGHLRQLGHREITYLAGPRDSWSDQQRRASVAAAAREVGMRVNIIELGRPSYDAARDAVSSLIASDATAAIAFDDVVAHGVLSGLAVRGIRVPADFSVVGCDDILAATTQPPLTTISAGSSAAGQAAVRLLMQILGDEELDQGSQRIAIGTHLVLRASADHARSEKARLNR